MVFRVYEKLLAVETRIWQSLDNFNGGKWI